MTTSRTISVPQSPIVNDPPAIANSVNLPIFLTAAQLAKLLGVSERKLEHDRHHGVGIPFAKFGRRVLYRREDVLAHLTANVFSSTAEAKRSGR